MIKRNAAHPAPPPSWVSLVKLGELLLQVTKTWPYRKRHAADGGKKRGLCSNPCKKSMDKACAYMLSKGLQRDKK